MTDHEDRPDSATEEMADVSEAWSLLVLRAVIEGARTRREIRLRTQAEDEVIAMRLELLVGRGLLTATLLSDGEPAYIPTVKGIDLYPVIEELGVWSECHLPDTADPDSAQHP